MTRRLLPHSISLTGTRLIILVTLLLVAFYNHSFFRHLFEIYPVVPENLLFIASVAVLLGSLIALLLALVDSRYILKPVLLLLLVSSSFAAYFMDTYNIVIDSTMIQNTLMTDAHEVADLITLRLVLYVLLLGVLPSVLVWRVQLRYGSFRRGLFAKARFSALLLALITSQLLLFGDSYASFFREHKIIRYYTNPITYLYSIEKSVKMKLAAGNEPVEPIGLDAHVLYEDPHRELTVLVVGETARADRLSLNGYGRKTNPLLEKEQVISFTRMYSCGTSTATSVPCMFSPFGRSDYDDDRGHHYENLLDVAAHAGVHVLWRDNNSDSKGVALRVPHADYKSPQLNTVCDPECRDVGMLEGLQEYIDGNGQGDILIVLHQMGSHGPAYYKRYPASFEVFRPVCKTSHLNDCSAEQINNAYDNTIRYTDYFLSRIIELLKKNSTTFETALVYVSDHGESLGESGVYLHGLPYFFAPDAQKHVAALFWFGDNYDEVDVEKVRSRVHNEYSHDNIFHTVLGLMEIDTGLYDRSKDIVFSD